MQTRELAEASGKPLITAKRLKALDREKKRWLRVDAVLAELWGLQPLLS